MSKERAQRRAERVDAQALGQVLAVRGMHVEHVLRRVLVARRDGA